MLNYDDRPIIACSSGNNRCAVSLIRISGESFFDEINHSFSIDLNKLHPRMATFCRVLDGEKILDEVVVTFFKGPNSYNGEDVLEISAHGNPVNVKRIISKLKEDTTVRDAYPGEFSLRAMNNKKLSLTQVEGLDLLLNSNSIFSLDQGLSVLSGNLKNKFLELYHTYLEHRSSLELGFDFLEDIGEEQFNNKFKDSLENLKLAISDLYSHHSKSPYNLIKPEIALAGLPNSGKSSLFNKLLNSNRSIVSDIAGTTRDYISEDIYIQDTIFTLIDTAGVRETSDLIEKAGVERTLGILKDAFFKILLVNPKDFNEKFFENFSKTKFDLILFTHSDQDSFGVDLKKSGAKILRSVGPIEPADFGPIEPADFGPIEPVDFGPIEPVDFGPIEPLIKRSYRVDLTSTGDSLVDFIYEQSSLKYQKLLDFDPILIERHNDSIKDIYQAFQNYYDLTSNESDISIVASELNILGHCISELIGIVSPDDVLHNIFDNFCIGK